MNFDRLTEFLDYSMPMFGVIGSDTVIYRDHEPIYRHLCGYDNFLFRTPMRDNAMYNIYSCTKLLAGVAAAQLVERGEMLITDPVYAYFPEFRDMKVKVKDENGNVIGVRPAEKPMLIKHLLSMTSGLDYTLQRPAIDRVIEETDGRAPTLDVCRALAEEPLDFEPGTDYQYSLSLDLLGGIIELISATPLCEYVKENIFDPLGMNETSFRPDPTKSDRFATQYTKNNKTGKPEIIPFEKNHFRFGTEYDSLGAGIVTTVDDYILLVDALANGGVGKTGERILSRAAVDLMRTNQLSEKIRLETFSHSQCTGYGYGFGVRCCMDKAVSGNLATVGSFGWDGWKSCLAIADPEKHIAIFHAEHLEGNHAIKLPRLRNAIYACLG